MDLELTLKDFDLIDEGLSMVIELNHDVSGDTFMAQVKNDYGRVPMIMKLAEEFIKHKTEKADDIRNRAKLLRAKLTIVKQALIDQSPVDEAVKILRTKLSDSE